MADWATCMNCGRSIKGLTTETCSAACTRELAQRRQSARRRGEEQPGRPAERHRTVPERRGRSTSPGPVPSKKGFCDCDGDLCLIMKLNVLLTAAAVVVPNFAGGPVARLIRFYQRWLTRFTPRCPSQVSCSQYALDAVREHGPRKGLTMAARRVQECGR